MRNILVAVTVLAVLAALAFVAFRGTRSFVAQADAISEGLITRYLGLIQQERYEEAWRDCLAPDLQARTPQVEFVQALRQRAHEHGSLGSWTLVDYQQENDLFSSERLVGVNLVLHYERRDIFVLYKVDTAVEPHRIGQAFGSPGRSTNLSEGSW